MVCTNVPGPQFPLYLLGHKMLGCYPYVPVGGEMTMNCAILTYDGTAYFGFSGCAHAAPDLRRLETFLKLSFTELQEAAGISPGRNKEDKKPQKKVRAKAKAKVTTEVKVAPRLARVPASVRAAIPAPPASVESTIAQGPPVKEDKVLTQLIA